MSERNDPVALSIDPHRRALVAGDGAKHTFDVVIVGDFCAREHGGRRDGGVSADRDPLRVESLDEALATLRPSVDVRLDDGRIVALHFDELDDFHPDRLLERLPELPRGAAAAGADQQAAQSPEPATEARREPGKAQAAPTAPSAGLLDDIVTNTKGSGRGADGPLRDLRAWVSDVVEPHLRHGRGDEGARSGGKGAAAAAALRDVLHHPAVRALERFWRSLLFLARSASSAEDARLFLLDLPRPDIQAMLEGPDPSETALFRLLRRPLPGRGASTPIGLLVLCYDLGAGPSAVSLLNRVAMVAHTLGAPCLAAAEPGLVGLRSFARAGEEGTDEGALAMWGAFRATPAAASIALFAPRFLLREPYGRDGEPCEALDFEELTTGAGYLWGNPAVVGAAAALEHFGHRGWQFDLESPHVFEVMPIHILAEGGVGAHPLEETLSVDAAVKLQEMGVNPLVGFREEARARLTGILSASSPSQPLRSWWRA